jgi:beta-N-acetylhexosaminidase
MLSFDGLEAPRAILERLRSAPAAGFTLYRWRNAGPPAGVRALTASLVEAAGGPLLIAADQEGGQLDTFGDGVTAFPGAMALGATGDERLAARVAHATGLELRAMGVNVCYAPVLDVATDPANPAIGIRSFGSSPEAVARFGAATVRGLAGAGVAATAKHFPGIGDIDRDSHHELPLIPHDRDRFERVELVPFRAAIAAGASLVMSGHVAVPALTGRDDLPATLSSAALRTLLRDELGFDGVTITDALDMHALAQGANQVVDVLAAIGAGVDLLLLGDPTGRQELERSLVHAAWRGLVDLDAVEASLARIDELRARLAAVPSPDLSVVGSTAHRALAAEVAARSITLVRDDAGLVPLRFAPDARILAIMPRPSELTPADTSSAEPPLLASALRRSHPRVDELVVSPSPSAAEIAGATEAARSADLIVLGTISASLEPAQVALVEAVVALGRPTITVALRTPFDLASYPASTTHLCTYGLREPSLTALGAVLAGEAEAVGRLPTPIGDLYPVGWGRQPGGA